MHLTLETSTFLQNLIHVSQLDKVILENQQNLQNSTESAVTA